MGQTGPGWHEVTDAMRLGFQGAGLVGGMFDGYDG